MIKLLFAFLFAVAVFGQNTPVHDLTPSQAATGKRLYDQKVKADEAWCDWKVGVEEKLGLRPLEFSDDFRHALPSWQSPQLLDCGSIILSSSGTMARGNYGADVDPKSATTAYGTTLAPLITAGKDAPTGTTKK